MAIAFDKTFGLYTPSSATSTVNGAATAADELAIIFVWNGNNAAISSVTVGGNPATAIVASFNGFGASYFSAWYYLNPPTSGTDYVATATNATDDVEIHVLLYSGAALTGVPDSFNTGSATGNLTLSTTVVASDCWLASFGRNANAGLPTAGTGTTLRSASFDTAIASGDSNGTVGTGAQTMGWNAAAGTTAGIIVSFAPAGGGGGGVVSRVEDFMLLR